MEVLAARAPRTAPASTAPRTPGWARAAAGPLVIAGSVLFALRAFAFHGLLTNQHPDVLAFWLPRFGFLGRSLAAGHVPLWNPSELAGAPFAADPQSGWLYLPAMALYAALPPATATRALIVWNPLLGGLGLYAFLRGEGLGRPAATAGGLSLALAVSASVVAISLPFAGALAWTTVVLVGAGGYRRAVRWSARLAWLALAAFGWGQLAGAHMSHGLAMGTAVVAAYLVAWSVHDVRAGVRSPLRAALEAALFLAALPAANVAILLPRAMLVQRSSLRQGYAWLVPPLDGAGRAAERPIASNGVWAGWPFSLASAPGAYVGAAILLAAPAAWRSRERRPLVAAFALVGAAAYALTLNALVTAGWFRSLVLRVPYGDVYLHNPGRLRYLAYLVVPVLGAVGIQALADRPPTPRAALAWLVPPAGAFLVLPILLGAHPVRFALLAAGVLAAEPALAAIGRRRGALLVVGLLAVELLASAGYSQAYRGGTVFLGLEGEDHPNLPPGPLRWPDVRASDYVEPGPIARYLEGRAERYLTWVPPDAYFEKGYLWAQEPGDWPMLANNRATLFGLRDALGYNPVQPPRYWAYIRATNPLPVFYNASVLADPTLEDARLLGVRYLVVPEGLRPRRLPGTPVASDDSFGAGYELVEIPGWEPLVSAVPAWRAVDGPREALRAVLEPGFDPAALAVLEEDPGLVPEPGAPPGTASLEERWPEDLAIEVRAPSPQIVVVRTNHDRYWEATVDGRPAPLLRADFLLLGVPVPPGRHEVRLLYRDPWIGRGLALSALAWTLLAAALVLVRRREARGPSGAPPSPAQDA
ncbi:MAG TPA: hypothetical protein VNO79_03650 [Actinomycetota bacterium]|nr:hypothetical protein [Actinomycetota bacterium]